MKGKTIIPTHIIYSVCTQDEELSIDTVAMETLPWYDLVDSVPECYIVRVLLMFTYVCTCCAILRFNTETELQFNSGVGRLTDSDTDLLRSIAFTKSVGHIIESNCQS